MQVHEQSRLLETIMAETTASAYLILTESALTRKLGYTKVLHT